MIWKHCLRNALIPVLTLWGVFVGNLITGAIIVETVFAWPKTWPADLRGGDLPRLPTVAGHHHPQAMLILLINLSVDILYAYVDPRIRLA